MTPYVLVLYYSRGGSTRWLAEGIARGVRAEGMDVRLRTVAPIAAASEEKVENAANDNLVCSKDDLTNCSALAMGSPTRFGNMAAPLKHFVDQSSDLWMSGALINKPAAVFSSSSSMHGGQESTLLTMQLPLLHHGMLVVGLPYSEAALHTTQSGGTPYGPTHVAGPNNVVALAADEQALAVSMGKRLAMLANKLGN